MAVQKRTLDDTHTNARNARARLFYHQLHPQPQYRTILRRPRFGYAKAPPLDPVESKENISVVDSGVPLFKSLDYHPSAGGRNRIRFYNKVFVLRIPSRDQYPESIKKKIWSPLKEIKANARRNSIEFASEGWDWRSATEDEAMYVAPNGDRIHPVHVRRDFRAQAASPRYVR